MNKMLCFVVALFLICACGVKTKGPGTTPAIATAGPRPLSSGLFVTHGGKFVAHPSRPNFLPGGTAEENTVVYRFATNELLPVDMHFYTVEIDYDMPDMPGMGINKDAFTKPLKGGELEVKYPSIVHGSASEPWEFRIRLLQGGALIDTLVYRVLVPTH
jgi:hypothetical protein